MSNSNVELKPLFELRPELESGQEIHFTDEALSYFKYDGVYYEVNGSRAYPIGKDVDGEWVTTTSFEEMFGDELDKEPMCFVGGPADAAYKACKALGMFEWWGNTEDLSRKALNTLLGDIEIDL